MSDYNKANNESINNSYNYNNNNSNNNNNSTSGYEYVPTLKNVGYVLGDPISGNTVSKNSVNSSGALASRL